MSVIYGLLLLVKGESKRIKLKDAKDNKPLTIESLQTIIKKKTPLNELGSYNFDKFKLTLFGYTSGKAGTENKHELPPPLDTKLCFSDILLIASPKDKSWQEPIGFTVEQYQEFYTKAFGGFEELDEDDSDEDDEEESSSDDEEDDEFDEEDAEIAIKNPELAKLNKLVKTKTIDEQEEKSISDEEVEDESEEFEEEEQEDDNVSEAVSEKLESDDEIEEKVQVKKVSKKKNSRYTNILSQLNSKSRQSQFMKPGFEEIKEAGLLESSQGHEKHIRTHILQKLHSVFGKILNSSQLPELETVILQSALREAQVKNIIKHFDNPMFRDCYMVSARRLIGNLNPNSYVKNDKLLPRILSGDLTMEHLASMSIMDFAPSLYAGLREQMLLREKQQLEGNKALATDMFKCGRCHKRECTFYEMQTRSADEPMTKFITCLNCGAHWRQ